MTYQGAASSPQQESERAQSSRTMTGTPDSSQRTEECILIKFVDKTNMCYVLDSSNQVLGPLRCRADLSELLMRFGEIEKIRNLPALIHWQWWKDQATVEVSDPWKAELSEEDTLVFESFYL